MADIEGGPDIDKLVEKALRNVYDGNYGGPFEPNLWDATVQQLNKAVRDEWPVTKPFIVDRAVTANIKYQNAVFSAFKSTHQTRSLEQLKRAAAAPTFQDFKKAAMPIVGKYNNEWLKSEYATAKRTMRSGQNYARALENTDLYPNLEYMPSRSANPREAHKPYYGTVLPVTHPWWRTHLAPLDWRCDCWFQPTKWPQTQQPYNVEPPQPGLDNNAALSGQAFSKTHPYFSGIDATVQRQIVERTVAAIAGVTPDKFALFELDKASNGSVFSLGKLSGSERGKNLPTARVLAGNGAMVQLNNHTHLDALVNGSWNEFKHLENAIPTPDAFDRNLRYAFKQFKTLKQKGDITIVLQSADARGNLINGFAARAARIADIDKTIENVHFIVAGKYVGAKSLTDVVTGILPF